MVATSLRTFGFVGTTLASLVLLASCTAGESDFGSLDVDGGGGPVVADGKRVAAYTGSNPITLEAQRSLRTGIDLHEKVVTPTCANAGGVCHFKKEYPDLHTPANLLAAVESPCNVQPFEYQAVFDRCEQPGDVIDLGAVEGTFEIGWVELIAGDEMRFNDLGRNPTADDPGLHIHISTPITRSEEVSRRQGNNRGTYTRARFLRPFIASDNTVQEVAYGDYEGNWWILGDGTHLYAEVRNYQRDRAQALIDGGMVQGDHNRNGVFGAQQKAPLMMIKPGAPEESYLVARLFGRLLGEEIPGTRMPLANEPYTPSEMLAMFCWIEGLGKDPSNMQTLENDIDYANCSYREDTDRLQLQGTGSNFTDRILPILIANCAGCHGGDAPLGELDLRSDGAHQRLLESSKQNTSLPLVDPGNPEGSYLIHKLRNNTASLMGTQPMPLDPVAGYRPLGAQELADIEQWITDGALAD